MGMRLPVVSNPRVPLSVVGASVIVAIVLWFSQSPVNSRVQHTPSVQATRHKPPWIYGRANARFTIVEYADLECPYCRAYFPVLQKWIREHPDVNWQWHHLPLSAHEPAATQAARLAECVGETGGNTAFWDAIARISQATRGGGADFHTAAQDPDLSPGIEACLHSTRPDAVIHAQVAAAVRDRISGTPTLRLMDQHTGAALVLYGPIEGDVLLSAIDLLATPSEVIKPASVNRAIQNEDPG